MSALSCMVDLMSDREHPPSPWSYTSPDENCPECEGAGSYLLPHPGGGFITERCPCTDKPTEAEPTSMALLGPCLVSVQYFTPWELVACMALGLMHHEDGEIVWDTGSGPSDWIVQVAAHSWRWQELEGIGS